MFLAKSVQKICEIRKNCVPLHRISQRCGAKDRDLAQLVAHTSGGREVAGSSPVIPTKKFENRLVQAVLFILLSFSHQIIRDKANS